MWNCKGILLSPMHQAQSASRGDEVLESLARSQAKRILACSQCNITVKASLIAFYFFK